jgi:hypothetical protein
MEIDISDNKITIENTTFVRVRKEIAVCANCSFFENSDPICSRICAVVCRKCKENGDLNYIYQPEAIVKLKKQIEDHPLNIVIV